MSDLADCPHAHFNGPHPATHVVTWPDGTIEHACQAYANAARRFGGATVETVARLDPDGEGWSWTEQLEAVVVSCVECGGGVSVEDNGVSHHDDEALDLDHVAIPDELDGVPYGSL